MTDIQEICEFLGHLAPPQLAEEWDNVGLLAGDRRLPVERIMTCLTITSDSAQEAIQEEADLIVTHHPLPFRAVKRLNTDSTPGRLLWQLIRAGVAIYSPHTAFDSAADGINQNLAVGLGLHDVVALIPIDQAPGLIGAGRWGILDPAEKVNSIAERLKSFLKVDRVQAVGSEHRSVGRIAVACGSAGQFLEQAIQFGCQLLVTGETTFHTCLEAEANDVSLLLPGHFASERFAVEHLADTLTRSFPQLTIWASRRERDPLGWL